MKILKEKKSQPEEVKRNLKLLIKAEIFFFKDLNEEAYVNFEKVSNGLKKYEIFHNQQLKQLESLIKQTFPNSKLVEYLNSDLFNYRLKCDLLNEFEDLLNAKEFLENEIGEYPKAIVVLLKNLRDISSFMTEIKSIFVLEGKNPNAKIFKNLCDCICLYERELKEIIKHHKFFDDWMTKTTKIAAYVKEHIETYSEKNNVIYDLRPSSIYLDKNLIEHQQDLRKSISELLSWYYEHFRKENEHLRAVNSSLLALCIYSDGCDLYFNIFQEILMTN